MKKLFRAMLCAGLLALLSVPVFAAQTEVPEKQGDFYLVVNGEYVTFTDAVPQARENRSFLPFAATFEQLGFTDITWDGETQTVTATKPGVTYTAANGTVRQGGVTVTLTLGSPTFSVQYEGDTTTGPNGEAVQVVYDFTSEAAPYADPVLCRTYVPIGLIADALGYNVGWDAQQDAVLIDDVDAILAANTETYTLMDKYMDYGRACSEQNQKVTGSYAMDLDVSSSSEGQSMEFGLTVDGDYSMITANSTAFQFGTDLKLDWTLAMNGADATELIKASGEIPEIPSSIDLDMRGNISDGVFYFQSAALSGLLGQSEAPNTWYKLDLSAVFAGLPETLGMDYAALIELSTGAADMSFEEYLAAALKAVPLTSADCTTSDVLAMVNALVGDSAFARSGSSYVSTVEIEGVALTMTLYTNGTAVNGYALEIAAADPSFGDMKLAASMKDRKLAMTMDFAMSVDDSDVTLTLTMDGVYQATSVKPVTVPPANASIIDLMN